MDGGQDQISRYLQARRHVLLHRLPPDLVRLPRPLPLRGLRAGRRPALQVVHPARVRPAVPACAAEQVGNHLACHGRRILQLRQERHLRAGRYPAEALLLHHLPGRAELRSDRDDPGPRDDPRVRRPGQEVQPRGEDEAVVVGRGQGRVRAEGELCGRAVQQHEARREARERGADAGREHRRHRRGQASIQSHGTRAEGEGGSGCS
mmetsp:Transcript_10921/g.24789  ORF Transcript_10921/g.24789 Transcript_10921/m.24789 type:complete len:206 (+) Transcript_10921:1542-2159(+)